MNTHDACERCVTIGLAGIGGYGEFYARELLEGASRHRARLAAAVDPAPERSSLYGALVAAGIPIYSSLDELYARQTPDLLVLATPIPLHAPQACLALARGSNVLCEKPAAATVQEALAMREAEQRSGGRFLAVGFQWSFSEAVQALKADILTGALGRPLRLKTMVQWPRTSAYYARNRWAGRIRDDSGAWVYDSPVSNATAHYLHNMLYLLGGDTHQSATIRSVESECYRANPIENFDTAGVRIITATGVEILFLTTHACPDGIGPVSVFEFENAEVTYSQNGGETFEARFGDGRIRNYGNPNAQPDRKLWRCVDAARDGTPIPCGIDAALPHLLCVQAVQEAADGIRDVPASAIRQRDEGDAGTLRWIDGIGEVFARCYECHALPGELGDVLWGPR
ncbi:MAG: Gfo/Idh/MocA family oxidoreductase [Lentisphaerae bacterium]|nr:Gfo/Idh/MocA family oxidoreductase [Lentisphaerota bacterium]